MKHIGVGTEIVYNDNDRKIVEALLDCATIKEVTEKTGFCDRWLRQKRHQFEAQGIIARQRPVLNVKGPKYENLENEE